MEFGAAAKRVMEHIREEYGAVPDYPWDDGNAVFRHSGSRKWFALIMGGLSGRVLGLPEERRVDVLNLKCDPRVGGTLPDGRHFFPAYHMNKEHWISVVLDEETPMEQVDSLIGFSYALTSGRKCPR